MKTAGEIKTALGMCKRGVNCGYCPYTILECAQSRLERNALEYIARLEAELEEEKSHHQHTLECAQQFEEDWGQMKQERDALLKYFTDSHWAACDICKHEPESHDINDCMRIRQVGLPCFEWRGLRKENGGTGNDSL